jgi:acetylglutamate kinase
VIDSRGDVLNQALPYIQQFQGQTFVVKYGGSAMKNPDLLHGVIRNVLLLKLVGIKIVLVHGGGPEIDTWLGKVGIEKRVVNGLRVTDDDTMEIVEMALAGRANKALVAEIQKCGGKAVGLSGRDGDLFVGEAVSAELGRVGNILNVNPDVLHNLLGGDFIPVVCSVAHDSERKPLNVNADSAAGALAAALGATKLILLTDTHGVLADRNNIHSTITKLAISDAEAMIASGRADGGMIPKLQAAVDAVRDGVKSVHLVNGSSPNSLLLEVFTDAGVGTMIS